METPKRRKRGQNEGGCYQRKDGRWEATLTLEAAGGKPRRKSYYGRTKAEAMAAMRRPPRPRRRSAGRRAPADRRPVPRSLARRRGEAVGRAEDVR